MYGTGGHGGSTNYGDHNFGEPGGNFGASQFAGGGFMPSSPPPTAGGGGSGPGAAFSPTAGGAKRGSSNRMFPVTVRQIGSSQGRAAEESLMIGGVEVNHVTVVGRVSQREERETDFSFILDDGTGRIQVKKWLDLENEYERAQLREAREGIYVRVYGHLRSFQGKMNISAFSLRPIVDFNEVTCHFLDCIFAALHSKAQQSLEGAPAASHAVGGNTEASLPSARPAASNQYAPPMSASHDSRPGGLTELQNQVLGIYKEACQSNRGRQDIHYGQVAESLQGVSRAQVKAAVDFLVIEGLLFSTVDDDHFQYIE